MDSLIEKVVIGATDEDGNPNPYVITFVFKAGMKFNEEFYEKIANPSGIIEAGKLSTYATNEKQLACTYTPNKAHRMSGIFRKLINYFFPRKLFL